MKPGWLKFGLMKLFSRPAQDRAVYRLIDRGEIRSITEIGVGSGRRSLQMLDFALRHHAPDLIRFAGFDLFEARPVENPGLTLKQAHRKFQAKGVQVRLVPGDILSGVLRSANSLLKTDLIVVSAEIDHATLGPAWFYFPRMLHEKSIVLLESGNVRPEFQPLTYPQVVELAQKAASTVRRAA